MAKWSYEEISEASKMITNEYDWTIGYSITAQEELDKKMYSAQLLKVNIRYLILEVRTNSVPINHSHHLPQPTRT